MIRYNRDFRYSVVKTYWRFSYWCNHPGRKHWIWLVTPDWRKWTRRVQPLERSNRRTRMWCHPRQSRVRARYGGLPGKRRVLEWRELRPWLMVCGRDSPRNPPSPPSPHRPVVTVGGHRSEKSERNTTPRGRREARGRRESWMVWEWVEDLKKSIKVVPSYICLFLRPYET